MSALENDDLAAFEREAGRVLRSHPEWLNIVLAQTDGRQLVNTAAPVAVAAKPPLFDTAVAQRVTSTRQPAAGSMITGPLLKQRGVNVAVPVVRGDEVRYVLLAFMKPELFVTPIERQRIVTGWVSGLVDAEGAFIARVPPLPRSDQDGAPRRYRAPAGRCRPGGAPQRRLLRHL